MIMRLVFLYVQSRGGQYFAERVREEGYFYLIRRMVETGIIDEALILIESVAEGFIDYAPGIKGMIIRDMNKADKLLRPGDVIWCRGGWRGWHDMLQRAGKAGHWLMIYAANTGREKWPIWDIVLDDLGGRDCRDAEGRIYLDFRKPVNEEIIKPDVQANTLYDLCIGASHVHDRKGQWRAIEAMIAYKYLFGVDLTAIMPGGFRRGEKTVAMMGRIHEHNLDVLMPGMLKREDLCRTYNQSKIFIHLGSHGQGDRGPMEAMRCGCYLVVGYPRYHAPWVCQNKNACYVPKDPEDYKAIAVMLYGLRHVIHRHISRDYYQQQASVEDVSLPAMRKLFNFFRAHPVADRNCLAKEVLR